MSSVARIHVTVVLLLAAAIFASTGLVPGVWRLVTVGAGVLLAGIGLYLAIRRAHAA